MKAEEWRAGVPRECACGTTFMAYWGSAKLCLECVGRNARESAARSRERHTKSVAVHCRCGVRLRLNGPALCSECRQVEERRKRALDGIGFEVVRHRFVSGGGGPGTGKSR